MQFWWGRVRLVGAMLGICTLLGWAEKSVAAQPQRSGWYLGAGTGMNWNSGIKQAGWNRDTICYPDEDCAHIGGAPEGYRWFYDLNADPGAAFEISLGRRFGNVRLELSAAQRRNNIEQQFTNITYLDGSALIGAENSTYESRATTSVDDLMMRTLSLNAYYDFPLAESRIVPYLGAGLGPSFVELSGLFFHSQYSCKDPASDCDRPEQYNSRQQVDLTDTVLSKHFHAGLDYGLNDSFLLGLKLSYSLVDDLEDTSDYSQHPVPDLTNVTEISGMDHWSLMFGLRYLFGD